MKLKTKLFVALSACALVGGVSAGLMANKDATEAKATESTYTYYLTGSFNSWSTDPQKCILFSPNTSSEVKLLGHTFTGNTTFKALYSENGGALQWTEHITSTSNEKNSIASRSGINVYASGNNAGIHYNNDSNSYTFNIYYNFKNNHFYVDYAYKLLVGDKSAWMEGVNDNEVKASLDASSNDALSVLGINGTAESVAPQSKPSNNLTSESKIKVNETIDVYYNRDTHSTWVSGYSAGTTVVQDFCDSLLELGCGATNEQLAALDWDGEGVKEAINGATISLGDDKSYTDWGNVINEAATRYANLISNGLDPVAGVTAAARTVSPLGGDTVSTDSLIPSFVIGATAAVAIAGCSLLLLRRKHEN